MAAEQTNPAAIDLGVSSSSIEERMAAFVNNEPTVADDEPTDRPQEAAQQDQPNGQEQSDGLTPDDLPAEEAQAQPADEAFEIVHNGQTVKLSRDEIIRNAQQGFDYTQKTQDLARQRGEVQNVLQRAAMVEQMVPYVAQDLATVKAFESQLQQFNKAVEAAGGWVAIATSDPLEYPRYQAQYQQLLQGYQGAAQGFQHKASALQQEQANLTAYRLQHEAQVLVERIPEWKDPAKYQAGAQELTAYLVKQGADPQEVARLSDSLAVSIARKAMLYDKLVSAKADKSKQLRTVPPVPKPGAPSSSAQAEKETQARQRLAKTHTRESAVGLLLTRM